MTLEDQIAVFKYGLIAPVINDQVINKTNFFKKTVTQKYLMPGQEKPRKFSWVTLKKWLHLYRKHGLDGLKPSFRADRGTSRKIDNDTQDRIIHICESRNLKTVSNLYRHLLQEKIITADMFTEVTLRNFMKANNIQFMKEPKQPRKSFEVPHINILWTADFMHGPYVRDGKQKRKTYLCAIIDDHSRVITGARFFIRESSLSLQKTLKAAVLTYGVPHKFYCDNGKVFVSGYIHLVCAKLGIALIHSKPYDSPSRGKIERYFRTVRDMFLPFLVFDDDLTLGALNEQFTAWLQEYHHRVHSGTKQPPMDRYLSDLPNVKRREIALHEADSYFYHSVQRTVRNDCTIVFRNREYEVPAKYMGNKIELRFPLDNPEKLSLFENNVQIHTLTKLDKHLNSENTIRYSDENQEQEHV
jgi:putative transposase